MDLGSLLLIVALLILVVIFISRPFFEQNVPSQTTLINEGEHQVSTLLAERDQILDALQELDDDFAIGKIPEEEYPAQRKALLDRGVSVLRELDEQDLDGDRNSSESEFDAHLEAAIAVRRADVSGNNETVQEAVQVSQSSTINSTVADPDDDLEVMIANRRRKKSDKAIGFCPKCGGPLQKSDRFCPKCGVTVV